VSDARGRRGVVLAARLFKLSFYFSLLVCSFFAFAPSPPELPVFRLGDVVLHAFAFSFLTFLLPLAHPRVTPVPAALWMLGYGVLIEFVQSFEPERSTELKDLLVDVAGIAVGLLLARVFANRVREFSTALALRILPD